MRNVHRSLNKRYIADRGRTGTSGSAPVCMICLCLYGIEILGKYSGVYEASGIADGLFFFYGNP